MKGGRMSNGSSGSLTGSSSARPERRPERRPSLFKLKTEATSSTPRLSQASSESRPSVARTDDLELSERSRSSSKVRANSDTSGWDTIEQSMQSRQSSRKRKQVAVPARRGSDFFDIDALKRMFTPAMERIYLLYCLRIERWTFMSVLVITWLYLLTTLSLFNSQPFEHLGFRAAPYVNVNSVYLVCTVLCTVLLILCLFSRIYYKFYIHLSLGYWAIMITLVQCLYHLSDDPGESNMDSSSWGHLSLDTTPLVFFTCFVVHTMLPLSRRWSVLLGFFTPLTAVFAAAFAEQSRKSQSKFPVFQMLSDILIFICANVVGFCQSHLLDVSHRYTILHVKQFAENKLKTERKQTYEDKLLRSLLPEYIVKKMATEMFQRWKSRAKGIFFPLIIDRHEDVTLVFADIVGFTRLSQEITAEELVTLLNELYGKFDVCAQRHGCLRIKTLGDCYECVSGLPEFTPEHASNCVKLGLDMISAIRDIRDQSDTSLGGTAHVDMRIGVHSGQVLSGVIGSYKWTYDVWSNDVKIANHMETSGKPGRVHMTERTLKKMLQVSEDDPLPDNAFQQLQQDGLTVWEYAEGDSDVTDFIRSLNIRTFWVTSPNQRNTVGELPAITEVDEESLDSSLFDSEEDVADDVAAGTDKHRLSTLASQNEVATTSPATLRRHKARVTKSRKPQFTRRRSIVETAKGWGAAAVVPFHNMREEMQDQDVPESDIKDKMVELFRLESLNAMDEIDAVDRKLFNLEMPVPENINHFGRLQKRELRQQYRLLADTDFKFYLSGALVCFLLIMGTQFLVLNFDQSDVKMKLVGVSVGGSIAFIALICCTTHILPKKWRLDCWERITSYTIGSETLRYLFAVISTAILTLGYMITMNDYSSQCGKDTCAPCASASTLTPTNASFPVTTGTANGTLEPGFSSSVCRFSPYYLYSLIMTMSTICLFVRLAFWFKFILMSACLIVYHLYVLQLHSDFFFCTNQCYIADGPGANAKTMEIRGAVYLLMMLLTFLVLDHQVELNFKLDYVYKMQVDGEKEFFEYHRKLSNTVLNNILPSHAIQHFSNPTRDANALYSKQYRSVCVMFASVPKYRLASMHEGNIEPRALLSLNEMINCFDTIAQRPQFEAIMKIKTIGSMYMAAAGLNTDHVGDDLEEDNIKLMIEFASTLMDELNVLKVHLMSPDYHLRVGIYHGDIVAGVAGAEKPQFDIWGNCVNLASRMESNSDENLIQFDTQIKEILESWNFLPEMETWGLDLEDRGVKPIKNAGDLHLWALRKRPCLICSTRACERSEVGTERENLLSTTNNNNKKQKNGAAAERSGK